MGLYCPCHLGLPRRCRVHGSFAGECPSLGVAVRRDCLCAKPRRCRRRSGDLDSSRRTGAQPRTCDGQAIGDSRLRLGRYTAATPCRGQLQQRRPAYGCVGAGRPHDRGRERTPTRRTRGVRTRPRERQSAARGSQRAGCRRAVRHLPVPGRERSALGRAERQGRVAFGLYRQGGSALADRTQPEGCVADDEAGVLYVGEENHGVWTLSADPRQPAELVPFAKVADGSLRADVEGMALYRAPGEARTHLVVSSQGDSSFAVYDVTNGAHRGSFRVGGHDRIDAVSDTDGIAIDVDAAAGIPERNAGRAGRRQSGRESEFQARVVDGYTSCSRGVAANSRTRRWRGKS